MKLIVTRTLYGALLIASGVAVVVAGPLTSRPAIAFFDRLPLAVFLSAF